MKFFLLSDNVDTLTGMRLAGIKGIVVHEKDEILAALHEACSSKDIGVLLVTELLAEKIPEEIKTLRLDMTGPIVTIVPDRHGERRRSDYITNYIKESIGLKI
ncbi:MAG TPA: V-type ATP synthase subunit F [Bacillota bacterium]|nr:V-type ATP synthase subunit F [Bacillota bacterium]HPL54871.1 V-type ATP synthase subunit F [Bacillota bacterium]